MNKISRPTFLVSFGKDVEDKYIEIFGGARSADGVHYFESDSFYKIMERLNKAFLNEKEFCIWDPDEDSFVRTSFSKFKNAKDTCKYYVKDFV